MPSEEATYAPGAVERMTGVSAHLLRAWERRYGAVAPARTPGGARRYSERDISRLRLLRRAVDAGHPIGEVARLPDAEVARRLGLLADGALRTNGAGVLPIDEVISAAARFDVASLDRILSLQLAALGPRSFSREFALPVLRGVGDAWQRGTLSIAAEHAVSAALRNLVSTALRGEAAASARPTLLFTTPAGERHELGTLVAAIDALGAGARPVYLGPDLPAAQIALAARSVDARAVALGVTDGERAESEVSALREALPRHIRIWVGGCGAAALDRIRGIEIIARLEDLEGHVHELR